VIDSVAELFSLFDNSDFSLVEAALFPLKVLLETIRIVVDAIVAGLKFIGVGQPKRLQALDKAAEDAGYGGGSYINPMNRGGGTPTSLTTNTNLYLDGRVVAQSTDSYLGRQAQNSGTTRTSPRTP
jgi:hypothetical protein